MINDSHQSRDQDLLKFGVPVLFVLLWSSGFIAAKAGLAHAETLTFLSLRYAVVTVLMTCVALIMRAQWPSSWRETGHISFTRHNPSAHG